MKKTIKILVAIVASVSFIVSASAATNQKLLNYAKENVSEGELVQAERFLKQNDVTDEQADKIIALGNEIKGILKANNVKSYNDLSNLSKDLKDEIKDLAQRACDVVGAKLTYDYTNKKVFIVDESGCIYDIDLKDELNNTGREDVTVLAGLSSIAVIGVAAILYEKKRHA